MSGDLSRAANLYQAALQGASASHRATFHRVRGGRLGGELRCLEESHPSHRAIALGEIPVDAGANGTLHGPHQLAACMKPGETTREAQASCQIHRRNGMIGTMTPSQEVNDVRARLYNSEGRMGS